MGMTYLSTIAWKFSSHSFVMSLLLVVACFFHVNCCRMPPQVMIGIMSSVFPNLTWGNHNQNGGRTQTLSNHEGASTQWPANDNSIHVHVMVVSFLTREA